LQGNSLASRMNAQDLAASSSLSNTMHVSQPPTILPG